MNLFNPNWLPFIAVMLPILSTLVRPFIERKKHHHFTATITGITFILVLLLYPYIRANQHIHLEIDTGLGFDFVFCVDRLGFFVGLVSTFLWLLATVYGIEYLRDIHAHNRYNIFSLLSLGGMLGVVFTGNLFSLYIFFELLSVASAVLVFHEETPEAIRAGFKYLFMGIAGGLVLLFSIIATYQITGHGYIDQIGIGLKGSPWLPYIFWGYIIGFGVKAGIFPLHVWLPSAHPVAPSPASALLSGVMIKAGAYGIFRTVYNVVGVEDIFTAPHIYMVLGVLILAVITILLGSAVAITQKEIKRMLAYSSISQIGYVVMGITLLSPLGMIGGVMHILAHALMKGALFLCAGAIIYQTGLRQIDDLKGMGKIMPITTGVFTICAISMIGLPPFVGFISKWYLALGSLQLMKMNSYWPGVGIITLSVLLLSSLLNLIYYGPILIGMWFSKELPQPVNNKSNLNKEQLNYDPKRVMTIPLIILAILVLFFGICPHLPIAIAKEISAIFFPGAM